MKSSAFGKECAALLGLLGAVGLGLFFTHRLWLVDWSVPFYYFGADNRFPHTNQDIFFYATYARSLSEHAWLSTIERLGAPGSFSFVYFPDPYLAQGSCALLKAFCLAGLSWGAVINAAYLTGYALIAVSAFLVFRIRELPRTAAWLGALAYAFAPYHVLTHTSHLYLGLYYSVPWAVLGAVWIWEAGEEGKGAGPRPWTLVAIGSLVALNYFYYTVFAALFWCLAALVGLLRAPYGRRKAPIWAAAWLLGSAMIVAAACLWPVIVRDQGLSAFQPLRAWWHTEFWGLKPVQMLLPIREHFFGQFRSLAGRYGPYPISHVNEAVAMGALPAIAFLLLLFRFFLPDARPLAKHKDWQKMGQFSLWGLAVSVVGGLGTVFAILVTPEIRALYRMAVFLQFFAVFGLAILTAEQWGRRRFAVVFFFLAGAFVVLDQTGKLATPPYAEAARLFRAHDAYFSALEAEAPPGAIAFQWPVANPPEEGPRGKTPSNGGFLPYLHTQKMRWSYGSIRGSVRAQWLEETGALEAPAMANELRARGFSLILVDAEADTDTARVKSLLDGLGKVSRRTKAEDGLSRFHAYLLYNELEPRAGKRSGI